MAHSVDLEAVLGRKQAGKSTYLARSALASPHANAVHDPMGGFAKVARHPRFVHKVRLGQADRIVAVGQIPLVYDVELIEFLRWAKDRARYSTIEVYIDEGTMLLDENFAKTKRETRKLYAHGRHVGRGLKMHFIAQGANLIDHVAIEQADRATLFAMPDGYNFWKLRACGVPMEILDQVEQLDDFEYLAGPPGRPTAEWRYGKVTRL